MSYAEEEKYLAAANDQLKDVAALILEQGFRPEEVFHLDSRRGLFLDDGYLKILQGKTKAAKRKIFLPPTSLAVLRRRKQLADDRGDGPLFPQEKKPSICIKSVQTAHRFALKNSRVSHFRLYDLRHTFATRAAEKTDLVTLAAILGHARLEMVLRYAHPTWQHQLEAMENLLEHKQIRAAQEKSAQRPKRSAGTLQASPS